MAKTIGIRISDWIMTDIIGQTENTSERVKELLLKGHLYERERLKNNSSSQNSIKGALYNLDIFSSNVLQHRPDYSV